MYLVHNAWRNDNTARWCNVIVSNNCLTNSLVHAQKYTDDAKTSYFIAAHPHICNETSGQSNK